jgi:hypothetical protein
MIRARAPAVGVDCWWSRVQPSVRWDETWDETWGQTGRSLVFLDQYGNVGETWGQEAVKKSTRGLCSTIAESTSVGTLQV